MVGIIDYNAGNIRSVERALEALSIEYKTAKNPAGLRGTDKIIFPGVGEARYAMNQLKKTGFDSFLRDCANSDTPLLGICLGSQIIFEYSEESGVHCLGLLKGTIRHFSSLFAAKTQNPIDQSRQNCAKYADNFKIPHMGWNSLDLTEFGKSAVCAPLFGSIAANADVYFVHSYVIQPKDEDIVAAYCDYGTRVPAVIRHNNISAFQFHPEKSGETGLSLLRNFICEHTVPSDTSAIKNAQKGAYSC